ncbi:nucleotide sugar dehydrogenase [Anaeromassilibacillus sp. An200]|uniref:Nucleotide sugar dehydrogenase n=1 Tax=Candidatus Caccousia stercoris TaxID=2840723 RepID=A0A9D1K2D9_9FIRM|nr:nucleotide sugar dehydrogenase [Anaeromassilibacillus sp. An200]OUP14286.1 UDP-N-acetyl-D-glucosamine dehydrogenase [Anaeromassilibacillus sp. An200]HIS79674.1 nucleotide sugar dehydrogenase [Candidatus Caccousia stercoris]
MSNVKQELLRKIADKSAVVGIVGLGYVGLPLAVEMAEAGYKTIGFDVQAKKVELVNAGHNYIGDIVGDKLKNMVETGFLRATSDFDFIRDVDAVAICVPTPLDKYQQPDISYVKGSTESVAEHVHPGMLVVLESTTYPGTTEELLKPILEKSGLVCGKDFYLAFSPERVDPGNKQYKTKNTPKVVGGITKDCTEIAAALYRNVLEGGVYEVSSPAVAEMEKLLENTYRNINIGLANEMAIICNRMGINVWEVIEAAKTKPYGFQAFYPGPGLGGHCIPLDPFYLTWKAREYDYHTRLIETSGEINTGMPEYVVDRVMKVLNKNKTAMNGAKVLVLGVAYKNDIDDYRESPALNVIDHLLEQGAETTYYDPYIPEYKHKGKVHTGAKELTDDMIREADIVVICTAHECFDYDRIQKLAKEIFDTRNAMKNVQDRSNIELL